MKRERPAGLEVFEEIKMVECIVNQDITRFTYRKFTKGKKYQVIGMVLQTSEDGSSSVMYLVKNNDDVLTESPLSWFKVIDK